MHNYNKHNGGVRAERNHAFVRTNIYSRVYRYKYSVLSKRKRLLDAIETKEFTYDNNLIAE
jgi:hypothetical protein